MDAAVALTCRDDGRIVITPRGELDVATIVPLTSALRSCDDGACVVVDLTDVTFLDSSTLAALAGASRRCEVSVAGASKIVRRVFEVGGLSFMLTE